MDWLTLIVLVVALAVFFRWFKSADCDLTLAVFSRWSHLIGQKNESLKGKVIWVTGASSGIGEGLAVELAGLGAKLVLSARRKTELDRVKQECLATGRVQSDDVLVLPLDLLDYDSHAGAADTALNHFGHIDVLINNAGRSQRALAEETETAVDKAMLDLNVVGTLSVTKAVLPSMLKRKAGHIVCISSTAGKLPAVISASYSTSKYAVQGFFNTLRMEVADRNVSVTLVCPGPVVSDGSANAMTAKIDELVGAHSVDDKRKIPTQRCAHLVVVAIANRLGEVWIARNPILFFTYLSQYMPTITTWIGKPVAQKRIRAFKEGSRDINAGLSMNPLRMLFG